MSRIYINNDWLFAERFKEDYLSGAIDTDFSEARIPHTTKELPFNYFSEQEYQMVSAYRKVIYAPAEWLHKRILLTFDGAAHYAEVFLNGKKIGEHYSGYTAFTIELTKHLRYAEENVLLVKLDSRENLNIPPFGNVIDYMTFGGIYRDAYIDVKESTYIADVFLKPEATGKLLCDVTLDGDIPSGLSIRQVATLNGERIELCVSAVSKNSFTLHSYISDPKLWSLENPTLYTVETELFIGNKIIDTHKARIGFRSVCFNNDGFYLNGRKIKIRGLNRHQSYPYVGYAMPRSMQEKDADILKRELGVNAVRTSHYPQSHYFIDRCDEIGLLVFTEIPGWQHVGDSKWKEQALKNVEEMILQYRNHPSIMIWGVRINESRDYHDLYVKTNALAHELDPTRQTGGVRNFKRSELLEDVYTYNDFLHDGKHAGCDAKINVTSNINKPYLITENNGHMFPTKSFDCEEHRLEHALRHASVLDSVASYEDICGSFSWCMFDYNTHKDFGSGDRICYHGVTDMFRNHKLAASVYASQQKDFPVLAVSSSMDIGDHPACVKGGVWIFSNADGVRMYKNDVFIKEFKPDGKHFANMVCPPMLVDDYIGNLLEINEKFPEKKAINVAKALNYIGMNGYGNITPKFIFHALKCILGYRMKISQIVDLYTKYVGDWGGRSTQYRFDAIKNGKVVKSVIKAPMNQIGLEVSCSSKVLHEEESYDVAAVRIRAVDEFGNTLPYCQESIKIKIDGPLELIGPESTALRGGMGGFYVKTIGRLDKATVTVSMPQIDDIKIYFDIK